MRSAPVSRGSSIFMVIPLSVRQFTVSGSQPHSFAAAAHISAVSDGTTDASTLPHKVYSPHSARSHL